MVNDLPSVGGFYKLSAYIYRTLSGSRPGLFAGVDREDAIQDAVLHCWQITPRYDPAKGAASTFFTIAIRRHLIAFAHKKGNHAIRAISLGASDTGDEDEPAIDLARDVRREVIYGPVKLSRRRGPIDVQKLKALVRAGLHGAEIARRLDVPEYTVSRAVKKLGLAPEKWKRQKIDRDRVILLYRSGLTASMIVHRLKVSRSPVDRILKAIRKPKR